MESCQINLIRKHRVDLIQNTTCTTEFLSIFFSKDVLSTQDVQIIRSEERNSGSYAASNKFYDIITNRTNAFSFLLNALEKTKQTGALKILEKTLDNQQSSCLSNTTAHSHEEAVENQHNGSITTKFRSVPSYLDQFLEDPNVNILIVFSEDSKITCDRLNETYAHCQIFHVIKEFLEIANSKIVDTKTLPVLNCEEKLEQNLRPLTKIQRKFILVSCKSWFDGNEIGNKQVFKNRQNNHFLIEKDNLTWDDLVESFQLQLCNRIEKYPNIGLTTNQIWDALEEVDYSTLVKIINEETLTLFSKTIPAPIEYYIPRSLSYRNVVGRNIFTTPCTDVFMFKGIHKEELQAKLTSKHIVANSSTILVVGCQLSRFVVLDHDNHFSRMCNTLQNTSAHLLYFNGNEFSWEKTFGKVDIIQQCLRFDQPVCSENKFLEHVLKVQAGEQFPICISDTPGMGKTVLLANIARTLQEKIIDGLVGFLSIGNLMGNIEYHQLNKNGTKDTQQIIMDVITGYLSNNSIGAAYLRENKKYLKHICLDGFDEISSEDETFGHTILKTIRQVFPDSTLWVTTRPHMLKILENELGVMGFNIIPFCEIDQTNLLTSFWNRNTEPNLDRNKLPVFAKHCLENIKLTLDAQEQDIAGIPLQCFLIGEVFEEEAATFCRLNDEVISKNVGIHHMIQLYEKLVDKKINIFYSQYKTEPRKKTHGFFGGLIFKLLSQIFSGAPSKPLTRQDLINIHTFESLKLFFPELALKLRSSMYAKDLSQQQIVNCGLMEVKHSFNPSFVHRTIAEYFVAILFTDLLHENYSKPSLNLFFDEIFRVQKTTINPTNEFVLNCFEFKNNVICYFIVALLGRKPLPSEQAIKLFSHISIGAHQQIAKACAAGNFQNIFMFLFSKPDTLRNIYGSNFLLELIFITVYRGCLPMLLTCVGLEKFNTCALSDYRYKSLTLLHFAVYGGSHQMVKYLCECGNFGREILLASDNFKDLATLCIKETKTLTDKLVEDRRLILNNIWTINKNIIICDHSHGKVGFLQDDVHIKLSSEMIGFIQRDQQAIKYFLHTATTFLDGTTYSRALSALFAGKVNSEIFKLFNFKLENFSLIQNIVQNLEPHDELCEFLASIDFDALSLKELIFQFATEMASYSWLTWLFKNKNMVKKKVLMSSVHSLWKFDIRFVQHVLNRVMTINVAVNKFVFHGLLAAAYYECSLGSRRLSIEDSFKYLCTKDIYSNGSDLSQVSALHLSLNKDRFGRIPVIVKLLVHKGVDINIQDIKGDTPLHISIANNLHPEVISSLLKNHADANIENNNKDSPLLLAVSQGISEMGDEISIITKGNVSFEKQYAQGNTILHMLIENTTKKHLFIQNGFYSLVSFLKSVGGLSFLQIRNDDGKTPLQLAIERGLVGVHVMSVLDNDDIDLI